MSTPVISSSEDTSVGQQVRKIPTRQLRFDPQNPRFFRLNEKAADTSVVLEEMLDDESVQDLMLSIGSKGYFPGEPLLVVPDDSDGFLVIEGNRRLAAVKLLNSDLQPPENRKKSVRQRREESIVSAPKELPCIVYPERKEILKYLGYRHITGVKQWDSLSKAQYLLQLKQEFYSTLDKPLQLKSLAADIGSKPAYVGQLLCALELYTKALGPKKDFLGLPIRQEDIEFSYITTALGYRELTEWLGLEDKSDHEMPKVKLENIKKIFGWLFSKDQTGKTIVGESRNIGKLAKIVSKKDALSNLESSQNIEDAYLYTDGNEEALSTLFQHARKKIEAVWAMIGNSDALTDIHLKEAEGLRQRTNDIRNAIRNKIEETTER
jgi:ParB-like nuclease domain